jgi:hypothetical protein
MTLANDLIVIEQQTLYLPIYQSDNLIPDEDLEDLRAAKQTRRKFLLEGRAAFVSADQHKAARG